MASLVNRPKGHKWIQFRLNGKRHTLRLGPVPIRDAQEVLRHVEQLIRSKLTGQLDPSTARWVTVIAPQWREKLQATGLVDESMVQTLGGLMEYIWRQLDVQDQTKANYRNVRRHLVQFFGEDRELRKITQGDCEEFRVWLTRLKKISTKTGTLAPVTASNRVMRAKYFFNVAVKKKWIDSNPFDGMKGFQTTNPGRFHFVDRERIDQVFAVLPDIHWKLILALARYGGLRCPSEIMKLRWCDIDWENGTMNVRSPKTAHHAGKEQRIVPIFPEIRPHLEACWEAAEEGEVYCVKHRKSGQALSSDLRRYLRWANLVPWPKLFQNLRSTRETELVESFPVHVACAWIGNSARVAEKHYFQVTKEHLAAATNGGGEATAKHFSDKTPNGETKSEAGHV